MLIGFSIGECEHHIQYLKKEVHLDQGDIDCLISTILDVFFYYPEESEEDGVMNYLQTHNIVVSDNSYAVMMSEGPMDVNDLSALQVSILRDIKPLILPLRHRFYTMLRAVADEPDHIRYIRMNYDNEILVCLE